MLSISLLSGCVCQAHTYLDVDWLWISAWIRTECSVGNRQCPKRWWDHHSCPQFETQRLQSQHVELRVLGYFQGEVLSLRIHAFLVLSNIGLLVYDMNASNHRAASLVCNMLMHGRFCRLLFIFVYCITNLGYISLTNLTGKVTLYERLGHWFWNSYYNRRSGSVQFAQIVLGGNKLTTELMVENTDAKAFSFTTALHSYFKARIEMRLWLACDFGCNCLESFALCLFFLIEKKWRPFLFDSCNVYVFWKHECRLTFLRQPWRDWKAARDLTNRMKILRTPLRVPKTG